MKKHLAIALLALPSITSLAQESIRPSVAASFGKIVTIEAQFVEKPNDFYSQNLVTEPFFLKVITVDGKKLNRPVAIEYSLHETGKAKAEMEKINAINRFEAYETLYQPIDASPFRKPTEQGSNFALVHKLHIRRPLVRPLPADMPVLNQTESWKHSIEVAVAQNGTLLVAGKPCDLSALASRLTALADTTPPRVKFVADPATPFTDVAKVLEVCKATGASIRIAHLAPPTTPSSTAPSH